MLRVSRSAATALARKRGASVPARPAQGQRRIAAALAREPRREASSVVLWLPCPPSKNDLHQWTPQGIAPSFQYITWKVDAGKEILRQRVASVRGPYALYLIVGRQSAKDLCNHETAISDLLQLHGIIDNDALCQHHEADWDDKPGVSVWIREAKAA